MKLHARYLLLTAFAAFSVGMLTGCSSNAEEGVINLKVYNCEDYMDETSMIDPFWDHPVLDDEGNPISYKGVLHAFEGYMAAQGKKVRIIYDCYDTNETMLSSLKTGKTTYDVICASDYAIQKMMMDGLVVPFDAGATPNYDAYVGDYLKAAFENISATIGDGTEIEHSVGDYARGYMWGTVGVQYNPEKIAREKNLTEEEIKYDMMRWNSLWDPKYSKEMSIKDSMRDTYSVGIMEVFDQQIRAAMHQNDFFIDEQYLDEDNQPYTKELVLNPAVDFMDVVTQYSRSALADIFNSCDPETVNKVEASLLALKGNVFGFEVDSGKEDMVKGLVGMNLAWSGDATYSMDTAENVYDQYIYYAIPETGGNIWIDGWVLPKGSEHKDIAQEFVDFLSLPDIAALNMDSIGYTTLVAGDSILTMIRQWYDPRSYVMHVYHDASKDRDENGQPLTWEDSDFIYNEDAGLPDGDFEPESGLIYQDGSGEHLTEGVNSNTPDDYGVLDMRGSTYEAPHVALGSAYRDYLIDDLGYSETEADGIIDEATLIAPTVTLWASDDDAIVDYQDFYNAYVAFDDEEEQIEWGVRDLTYIFEGTLETAPSPGADTPETNPYLFFTDEIEEFVYEGKLVTAGRQFFAQYPEQELIPKLSLMRDFGYNNKYVLVMWENVKGNNLPVWGVVVFAIILAAALAGIGVSVGIKFRYHKIKVARRKQISATMAESQVIKK